MVDSLAEVIFSLQAMGFMLVAPIAAYRGVKFVTQKTQSVVEVQALMVSMALLVLLFWRSVVYGDVVFRHAELLDPMKSVFLSFLIWATVIIILVVGTVASWKAKLTEDEHTRREEDDRRGREAPAR